MSTSDNKLRFVLMGRKCGVPLWRLLVHDLTEVQRTVAECVAVRSVRFAGRWRKGDRTHDAES
jgi:hypothetical protein